MVFELLCWKAITLLRRPCLFIPFLAKVMKMQWECIFLILSSSSKYMRRMGRTYNLFDIVDLVGIDTTLSIFHNLYQNDNSIYVPKSLEKAINCSAFGRKNQTSIRDYLDLPC